MLEKKQLPEGLQPLDETQLIQEFQVEELEKRHEFSWINSITFTDPNTGTSGTVYY
jgi:hypothetical protein